MSDFLKLVGMAQAELKTKKNQYNSFGKYNYRSCEDILEAAKENDRSMASFVRMVLNEHFTKEAE